MYQSLYSKYRPTNFNEVVGQEIITTTLQNAIKVGKLSHAYLFNGTRGTGKTSVAKIFSRAINCESVQEPLQDNCQYCQQMSDYEITDIFELDAASNNGVDEIRKIIDNVKYLPINLKYKVYIIDEVHMLSKGAFNALLKTLESPPKHVIFILATTEIHKIPLTIISRCQRFDFRRISTNTISDFLETIVSKENISYERSAIETIANLANGGMRDALSLLEKVISYQNDVNYASVEASLQLASYEQKQKLLDYLINYETNQVVNLWQDVLQATIDPQYFIDDFCRYLKEHLITALNENNNLLYKRLIEILQALSEATYKAKFIANSNLLLEVTLLDLTIKDEVQAMKEPEFITKQKQNSDIQEPTEPVTQTITSQEPSEIEPEDDFVTTSNNQITINHVIDNPDKQYRIEINSQYYRFKMELESKQKYGLAKFFEISSVKAANQNGLIAVADKSVIEDFKTRTEDLERIIYQIMNTNLKLFIVTIDEWKKIIESYKVRSSTNTEEDEVHDLAIEMFGKEIVEKTI